MCTISVLDASSRPTIPRLVPRIHQKIISGNHPSPRITLPFQLAVINTMNNLREGFKKVYLIRHGQAECNISNDFTIPDAVLTSLGRDQCTKFCLTPMADTIQDSAELLLTSPQRRALSTTLLALPRSVERLLPESRLLLVPQLQEINDVACDRGSDRAVLESTPEYTSAIKHIGALDFSPLTDDWNKKKGLYSPEPVTLWERAQWVRNLIRNRKEQTVVVVAHGNFLRYIVGLDGYYDRVRVWSNVEARLYTFESLDDERAKLVPVHDDSKDSGLALTA